MNLKKCNITDLNPKKHDFDNKGVVEMSDCAF